MLKNQKKVFGSLKLDIAKAYDIVDWFFLRNALLKLSFADEWVQKVMHLVTTVKYHVKVNDSYTDVIRLKRGIRQGDPLSPYLFILCTKYFTALLNQYKTLGLTDGIKICRRAPVITHLLFANDSLLFLRLTHDSINCVRNLLNIYEKTSGLGVNFGKSEIMVSKNAQQDLIEHVRQTLAVNIVENHSKYLGLPVLINRNRIQTFQVMVDKIWSKTNSWKSISLSQGDEQLGDLKWKRNSSGKLDIKSAYKTAQIVFQSQSSYKGEQSVDSHLLKFIWKLPLPRKVKIFIWRGYHNGLPTGAQLFKRKLRGTFSCPLCQFQYEDDLHPYIKCWWSKAVLE
ncbi:hypothetical protein QQ045_021101 [Rhodiola kirilowii]